MKTLTIILSFVCSISLLAQTETELEIIQLNQKIYQGLMDDQPTPNYLFPISVSDSLIAKCKGTHFESFANQALSWYFSYVGDYKKTLELYANELETQSLATLTFKDLSQYKMYDAKVEITKLAKQYDFVLINEAHHKSQHRIFTSTLLEALKKEGFTSLAVESAGKEDTLVNQTKIPDESIGGLTMEPNYANLIRQAVKMGYKLVPYDYDSDFNFEKRDSTGASRLIKHQNKTKGKTLILCGYEHIDESQRALAYWLKTFSGKEVLTINQTVFTEENERNLESPYFQMAIDYFEANQPFVLKRKQKNFKPRESSDIFVYHPRTEYVNQRPNWLIKYDIPDKRFAIELEDSWREGVAELVLVQIFLKEEYNKGIPIDQFLVSPQDTAPLTAFLPKGKLVLRVENVKREMLFEQHLIIDKKGSARTKLSD